MLKLMPLCVCFFLLLSLSAEAQLSANPWLDPNTDEAIEEVYQKTPKKNSVVNYSDEETVVIDRSDAYIEVSDENEKSDDGFMAKVKNSFSKKETKVIPNTQENREIMAKRRSIPTAKKSANTGVNQQNALDSIGNFGFDFSSFVKQFKKSFSQLTSSINKLK